MTRRSRIVWRSRRGMRELDLLLERFVERCFDSLPAADQAAYERLLEYPDQEILGWVAGRTPAPDAALARVVRGIRAATD